MLSAKLCWYVGGLPWQSLFIQAVVMCGGGQEQSGEWVLDQQSRVLGVSFYLILKCVSFHQSSPGFVT